MGQCTGTEGKTDGAPLTSHVAPIAHPNTSATERVPGQHCQQQVNPHTWPPSRVVLIEFSGNHHVWDALITRNPPVITMPGTH
jgi:hypothetical protein